MVKTPALHAYIDANIFLSFYDFTNDTLTHLESLVDHLTQGALVLYLPTVTIDEYYRNRDSKIAISLKKFEDEQIPKSMPRIVDGYDASKNYLELRNNMASVKADMLKQIRADAAGFSLKADGVIQKLFAHALEIPMSEELLQLAERRRDLHQPPGKSNSLGDQVAWECLKLAVQPSAELHIISKDADWASALDSNKINSAILAEWKAQKGSDAKLYRSLTEFLNAANFGVKIEVDQERYDLVNALYDSRSYAFTHQAVDRLSAYDDFTSEEIDLLASAALMNTQVSDILDDDDIRQFFLTLIGTNGYALHKSMLEALTTKLGIGAEALG